MKQNFNGIRYAKAIHRISSFFLDQIIIGVLIGILAGLYGFLSSDHSVFEENYLAYFIISILYYGLCLSSKWQATPGMRAIGIYIATEDFQKLHITQTMIRYILFCLNIIIVGFISIFFGKVLIEIFNCNNYYELDLDAFLNNNEMIDIREKIALLSQKSMTYLLGSIFIFKLLLLYAPIFFTTKKQALYDYIGSYVVIKKDVIIKK